MNARAVAITHSLIEGVELSAEQLLIYEARVSNPENQGNHQTADKLIRFLIRQKHWSPFDMINFTVEVETSRAIAAQILRHWSIKPQEFSQRYATVKSKFEPIELRLKGATNRQSSIGTIGEVNLNKGQVEYWFDERDPKADIYAGLLVEGQELLKQIDSYYQRLIEHGVAPECARMFLPLTTTTTLYLNGSVRSWIFYLMQRTDKHAQKEHRVLAQLVGQLFAQYFPNVYKAVKDSEYEPDLLKEFLEFLNMDRVYNHGEQAIDTDAVNHFIQHKRLPF